MKKPRKIKKYSVEMYLILPTEKLVFTASDESYAPLGCVPLPSKVPGTLAIAVISAAPDCWNSH
jgi:hypothetical protein